MTLSNSRFLYKLNSEHRAIVRVTRVSELGTGFIRPQVLKQWDKDYSWVPLIFAHPGG